VIRVAAKVSLMLGALASIARAAPTTQSLAPPPANDRVDEDLVDARARPAGLLPYGPVSLLDPLWKQLDAKTQRIGLDIGFAYTALYQAASDGPGERDAAAGDVDVFGDWRFIGGPNDPNRGFLYFAAENRHELFTPISPADLRNEIGSLWKTTDGFNQQVLTLREIYWQQHIAGDRLIVRTGKLDAKNYYSNNYWQSDNKYFLNEAFSFFPVRASPGNGLGLNLTSKLSDECYVSTGFQDVQGRKTTGGFDTFFGDFNLFGAAEVGFTPTIDSLGKGTYRFTAWYRDAGETTGTPHDAGFDLSIDQRVAENLIPFFRYGWAEGNVNSLEQMIDLGVGWEGKLLTRSDVIAIAGSWGRPADSDLCDQYAGELFYRLQVSPDNQLTLGYQVIVNPTFDTRNDVVGVFECRWRVTF
jgi:porin